MSLPISLGRNYRLETTYNLTSPTWFSSFPASPDNFIATATNSTISLPITPLLLSGHDGVYYRITQD